MRQFSPTATAFHDSESAAADSQSCRFGPRAQCRATTARPPGRSDRSKKQAAGSKEGKWPAQVSPSEYRERRVQEAGRVVLGKMCFAVREMRPCQAVVLLRSRY